MFESLMQYPLNSVADNADFCTFSLSENNLVLNKVEQNYRQSVYDLSVCSVI